ncbi:unnamed protein product, partial [marine sediment metagenome]
MVKESFIDAVIVMTPIPMNPVVAIEALEAGKDVFLEKPMATNVKAGKELVKNKRNSIIELYRQIRKDSFDPFSTVKKKIGIFYGTDINPALELKKMIEEDN